MKKLLMGLWAIPILLSACQSKSEEVKEKLLPIIKAELGKEAYYKRVDSVFIYSLDTLTQLDLTKRKINTLLREVNSLNGLVDIRKQLIESMHRTAEMELTQAKLYNGYLGSPTLAKIALDRSTDKMKEAEGLRKQMDLQLDSVKNYLTETRRLQDAVDKGTVDSLRFMGYIASFRVNAAVDDGSLTKDSLALFFSPTYELIKNNP